MISVVATGIEAEASAMPAGQQSGAGKVFSFPPRGVVSAPATPVVDSAVVSSNGGDEADEDLLELSNTTDGENEADDQIAALASSVTGAGRCT